MGHIPTSSLNNLKDNETLLLLLYIMDTVINLRVMKMDNSTIKSRVMRLGHGIELIKMHGLDLLNETGHQQESHHLLISK